MGAAANEDGVAPGRLDDRLGDGLEGLGDGAGIGIAAIRGDIDGGAGEGGDKNGSDNDLFHSLILSDDLQADGKFSQYY